MYVPMLLVIVYSFNESKLSTVWAGFSLNWYRKLVTNREIMEALKNSLTVGLLCSLLSMIIGTIGAVGLDRCRGRLNSAVSALSVVPLMMPEIITGLVFLLMFSAIGLKAGLLTLVLAHSSFCIPYVFMTVKGSLSLFDRSTEEAARDLGASEARTFAEITMPQLLPGIVSGGLLSFAMSMDDVVISFFVTGPKTNTLPIKIYSQMKMGVTPEINALCTLMFLFTLAAVILFAAVTDKQRKKMKN
ncbi:MAG: ABC transporter permease [Clostridia bacterium]|nr:ABC transporter permease [Clostridia bacterium]